MTEVGIDRQREAIADLAVRLDLPSPVEYVDVASAFRARSKRPGWDALMAAVRAGHVDVILVYNVDRAYRRLRDLLDLTDVLQATGCRLISATGGEVDLSTADGILQARIVGSVAEHQSARTGERVAARIVQRTQSGVSATGSTPFGWVRREDGPGLRVDPETAVLVIEAYEAIVGGRTLQSIADDWNARGIAPVRAAAWRPTAIRSIIRQTRHRGVVSLSGRQIAANSEGRIVSDELWEAANRILADPARRMPTGKTPALLTGLAVCANCDRSMRGGGGRALSYKDDSCHARVNRAASDEYVLGAVAAALAHYAQPLRERLATPAASPSALALAEARERLAEAGRRYATGEISMALFDSIAQPLGERIAELEQAQTARPVPGLVEVASAPDPAAAFLSLPRAKQRPVVHGLLQQVRLSRSADPVLVWR
jgi:DNA invertase Pin-like site-specific DNA recombinase